MHLQNVSGLMAFLDLWIFSLNYSLAVKSSNAISMYLGRGHDGERVHDAVRVLLTNLADEERAHAGPGAAAQRVRQLETLQTQSCGSS